MTAPSDPGRSGCDIDNRIEGPCVNLEAVLLQEAIDAPVRSIDRRLGDELIGASRSVVDAFYTARRDQMRLRRAIVELEDLVGRP